MNIRKLLNFSKKTITILEWYIEDSTKTDCNPIGQRLSRDVPFEFITKDSKSKSQGIIEAIIFSGIDIGTIIIHKPTALYPSTYEYESIDGGHRKRAIIAFMRNEFMLSDGRYYKDLSDVERKYFQNYKLSFTIYTDLEPADVGFIFRTCNNTTPVNHMEMLNSYGSIPIANFIRETVREVPAHWDTSYNLNPLFELNKKGNYINLSIDNKGLKVDEQFARHVCLYWKNEGLGATTNKDLQRMYQSNPSSDEVNKLEKQLKPSLDFIYKMVKCHKRYNGNALPKREYNLFARLYLYMEQTYGNFSTPDDRIESLWKAINGYIREMTRNPKDRNKLLNEISPFNQQKLVADQALTCLTEYDSEEHVQYTLNVLFELGFNPEDYILVKDTKRMFSLEDRQAKLAEQGYVCAVDGEPLTMDDAQGDHIVPHSKGGKTEYSNLAMIRTKWNQLKGAQPITLNEFKLQVGY